MEYLEKLRDPRWQQKRLEIFNRDSWACKRCSSTIKTLHIHHLFYFKDIEPWDVDDSFLITLCEDCHISFPNLAISNLAIFLRTIWEIGFNLDDLISIAEWFHYFYKDIPHGGKTEKELLVGHLPIIESK